MRSLEYMMDLQPYRVIEAFTAEELEAKAKDVLEYEEEDENGYKYYYMPLGAPSVTPTTEGYRAYTQAFIVSSHYDGEEEIAGEFKH